MEIVIAALIVAPYLALFALFCLIMIEAFR